MESVPVINRPQIKVVRVLAFAVAIAPQLQSGMSEIKWESLFFSHDQRVANQHCSTTSEFVGEIS